MDQQSKNIDDGRHERGTVPNLATREKIADLYSRASLCLIDIAWLDTMRRLWAGWFAENYQDAATSADSSQVSALAALLADHGLVLDRDDGATIAEELIHSGVRLQQVDLEGVILPS